MHRGKYRVPTHRFPVDGIPGAFGTGYAKAGEPVDVDERQMRGYPRGAKAKVAPSRRFRYRRFSSPRVMKMFARMAQVFVWRPLPDAPEGKAST